MKNCQVNQEFVIVVTEVVLQGNKAESNIVYFLAYFGCDEMELCTHELFIDIVVIVVTRGLPSWPQF